MKGMLATGRFIVLQAHHAFAVICLAHDYCHLLRDFKKMRADVIRQVIEVFEVLKWHDNQMSVILANKVGGDEDHNGIIAIDDVAGANESVFVFSTLHSEADWTDVVGWGVVVHRGKGY